MAFFLPSYIQKRLLRYALSRLEFVDTDDLNLDKLGVTLGQRSVIELKDVGLRIEKLSAVLHLPPSVSLERAVVRLLRLTIPADLYASGIVVEIEGVDVLVKLKNDGAQPKPSAAQPRPGTGPLRGDVSSRPRIAPLPVHDPGGSIGSRSGVSHQSDDHTIPSSRDLAESFLQTEPRQEREELQAAIESQSQYLQESFILSKDDSLAGLGAPGGVSLPSFIANFFRGIGDRIQVSIKEVGFTFEVEVSQDSNAKDTASECSSTVRLLLKVSELALEGLDLQGNLSGPQDDRRSIIINGIQILLLSDPDASWQSSPGSSPSSPRLAKSTTKNRTKAEDNASTISSVSYGTSPSDGSEEKLPSASIVLAQLDSPTRSSRARAHHFLISSAYDQHDLNDSSIFGTAADSGIYEEGVSNSSSDSLPAFTSFTDSGSVRNHPIERPVQDPIADMQPEPPTCELPIRHAKKDYGGHSIDNREHAEMLARTGQIEEAIQEHPTRNRLTEDLAASKIFSHDEAESMYMSAVSEASSARQLPHPMPGGWDWTDGSANAPQLSSPNTGEQGSTDSKNHTLDAKASSDLPGATGLRAEPAMQSGHIQAAQHSSSSPLSERQPATTWAVKQLLNVDQIKLKLPLHRDDRNPDGTENAGYGSQGRAPSRESPQHGPLPDDVTTSEFTVPDLHGSSGFERLEGVDRRHTTENKQRTSRDTPVSNTDVDLSVVNVQLDISTIKLCVLISKEVISFVEQTGPRSSKIPFAETTTRFAATVRIKEANLEIHERVSANLVSSTALDQLISKQALDRDSTDDLLLGIQLAGVKNVSIWSSNSSKQRLSVEDLSLRTGGCELLSIQHDIEMRSSIKDVDSLSPDAFLANIASQAGSNKIDVQVKPLHISLDLLTLDDILMKSGGLSSLVDLRNSIVSTSTIRPSPRKEAVSKTKARTIRFEQSQSQGDVFDHESTPTSKISARFAEASIDLIGSECTMKLKSSAIKVIYRQEGLGMTVDRVILEGPFTSAQTDPAEIFVGFKLPRIEYLPMPKDVDLGRLIRILTPSSDKYDDEDDIMVDTLLRQRRKGAVLRLTVGEIDTSVHGLRFVPIITKLGSELAKLSSVAKYLPDDDRPGILSLGLIKHLKLSVTPSDAFRKLRLDADHLEGAYVSIPSLMAAQVSNMTLNRGQEEKIIGRLVEIPELDAKPRPPMIMCRFVADEMDPTIKLKLYNACIEYRVSTLIALSELQVPTSEASSTGGEPEDGRVGSPTATMSPASSFSAMNLARRAKLSLTFRESALGLNPAGIPSRALVVLTDASFLSSLEQKKENTASVQVKKASILIIDDTAVLGATGDNESNNAYFDEGDNVQILIKMGYVPVSSISSASATVNMSSRQANVQQTLDIELRNNLLVLETCADSTQTLISLLNALSPPVPPSELLKYRTEIMPIQDLLASFTGDAYVTEPGPEAGTRSTVLPNIEEEQPEEQELEYVSDFFPPEPDDEIEQMSQSYVESELASSRMTASASVAAVNTHGSLMAASSEQAMAHSLLEFREDYFVPSSTVDGTAHRWNTSENTYGLPNEQNIQLSPLRIRIRDVHIIWNLFDGYDWLYTRDGIAQAVNAIEVRAAAKGPRSLNRLSPSGEDEEESVIGDFLFNSIYIGIPANKDPLELANAINHDIDDMVSETGSSTATTTTVTRSPARRQSSPRVRQKKLRLTRSKQHKMTFELDGISADFLVFPPGNGEVESSLDIRVKNLTVFDHVPTSTWRKFATYMQDEGPRETDTNMVHLEILTVKPIPDLAASEMILKISVLPLRLHVDQDALDFMSRFFEFKDTRTPLSSTPSSPPFIQRVEVNPIKVKLDFKPKRVDYGGLRSGRTTEFMNFFVLDRADLVLRRVILYGVSGFDRLGIMLNNIWMPDVKRNQLPGVLAGLAPIRSLVDVGSGVKDLVVVPMREYKKDGRIVRSIQKGALAFAKTTTRELVNLGAKLAIGTQTVLQDAETMLNLNRGEDGWDDADTDDEATKQISLYADQPLGVVQGLKGAYASLERDLLLARDAIVAVPGELMASSSATGAAKAVMRQAPTIILRPAIGATKAIGGVLLGAGNTLDVDNRRRTEEKYKRH